MAKKVSKSYHKNINAKDVRSFKAWKKRSKLFAAAGLFVLAGGSAIWALKSFAATSSYGIFPNFTINKGGAYIGPELAGTKKGQNVVYLPPCNTAPCAITYPNNDIEKEISNFLDANAKSKPMAVRYCYLVKATVNDTIKISTMLGDTLSLDLQADPNYQNRCTKYCSMPWSGIVTYPFVAQGGRQLFSVSQMTIELNDAIAISAGGYCV